MVVQGESVLDIQECLDFPALRTELLESPGDRFSGRHGELIRVRQPTADAELDRDATFLIAVICNFNVHLKIPGRRWQRTHLKSADTDVLRFLADAQIS